LPTTVVELQLGDTNRPSLQLLPAERLNTGRNAQTPPTRQTLRVECGSHCGEVKPKGGKRQGNSCESKGRTPDAPRPDC